MGRAARSGIVLSRTVLIWRLAGRDLRHRPAQAFLLLLAITAATATLTLGLALHGVTSQPYQQTRAATHGPDLVAQLFSTAPHRPGQQNPRPPVPGQVRALVHAPGVTGQSGPYLLAGAVVRARGRTAGVEAEGRSQAPAGNLILALAAAGAGLAAGWLAAPLITSPGAGLVGSPGGPSLTLPTAGLVVAVALAVALAATSGPAVRAARTSTVSALADAARPPRRRARLIALSARLPVPLLLGVRLAARRPRRAVLGAASVAVTAAGVVAVLTFHATAGLDASGGSGGLGSPVYDRDEQMLTVLTIVLVTLAVLNVIVTAWATVLDARHSSALARALGATPQQVSAGVSAAQLLPALPGALLGIPLGIGLFAAASGAGTRVLAIPPAWWLAAAVLGTLAAVAGLAAIPARIGARRPAAAILQSELA
jgi:putative ABC transport system permease protein